MDRAETLRQALRKQNHARREYEEVKDRELLPEETPEQWSTRVRDLRETAEAADAEMTRLRPNHPRTDGPSEQKYQPPMEPGFSN